MVLAMSAYQGRFTLERLAKVCAELGQDVFDGPLHAFVEAIVHDGSVAISFAPRCPEAGEP